MRRSIARCEVSARLRTDRRVHLDCSDSVECLIVGHGRCIWARKPLVGMSLEVPDVS